MIFELSDTQRELQDMIARLMRDTYSFSARQKMRANETQLSAEIWGTFAELGLLGVALSEDSGGLGGGARDVAVVMEEFGKALCLEPFTANAILVGRLLEQSGEDQLLSQMVSGEKLLALAHTELDARFELDYVNTSARKVGSDIVLTGQKSIVLGGDVANAFIVSATIQSSPSDEPEMGLYYVERTAENLDVRPYRTFDDLGAAELRLDGVRAKPLKTPGNAIELLNAVQDFAIACLCAEAVGAMQAAFDITLDYIKTRKQFGMSIGSFQALQHKAVDMLMELEHAKSMAILAATYADEANHNERAYFISAAKMEIDRSARSFGQHSIQLHGGIGVTDEYAIGHYFRRLTAIGLSFGDIEFHARRMEHAAQKLSPDSAPLN